MHKAIIFKILDVLVKGIALAMDNIPVQGPLVKLL